MTESERKAYTQQISEARNAVLDAEERLEEAINAIYRPGVRVSYASGKSVILAVVVEPQGSSVKIKNEITGKVRWVHGGSPFLGLLP